MLSSVSFHLCYIFKFKLANKTTLLVRCKLILLWASNPRRCLHRTLLSQSQREFYLVPYCIVCPCSCYLAIVVLLSRKSQEVARTIVLSCASKLALSHTCYAVEAGGNFLESFSPFSKFRTNISIVGKNPVGKLHSVYVGFQYLLFPAQW